MALRERLQLLSWTGTEFNDDIHAISPSRVIEIRADRDYGGGAIARISEPDIRESFYVTRVAPVEARSYLVRPFDRALFEGEDAVLWVAVLSERSVWQLDEIVPVSRKFWRIYMTSLPRYAGRIYPVTATSTMDAGLTGSVSATA